MKEKNVEVITDYLYNNYYEDAEKFARVKMIGVMINHSTPEQIPSMIEKIAIFNSFKKSYPPEKSTGHKILKALAQTIKYQGGYNDTQTYRE